MTTESGSTDDHDPLPESWRRARDLPTLALVESSAQLPGLVPIAAWETIRTADLVVALDPVTHPLVQQVQGAGIAVDTLTPASAAPVMGRNLVAAAPTPNDRLARAALAVARDHELVALLLPPDDTELAHDIGITATHDADVEVEWVFLAGAPRGLSLLALLDVMDHLLDPDDGCPWDLQQTHESLAPHLVEETYEAVDAIDHGNDDEMADELGDVLLQVVFHARLAQARNGFDIDDVATGIADKLVRRHPHVFADVDVADAGEVKDNWERIKADEKPERTSVFDGVPTSLPSIPRTDKVLSRAARLGWEPDLAMAGDMLLAAATELAALLDPAVAMPVPDTDGAAAGDTGLAAAVDEAIGQVVIGLVALARAADRDVGLAVRVALARLVERFEAASRQVRARGASVTGTDQWQAVLDEIDAHGQ